MSLFPSAEGLRDATIEAARQLGLFAALPAPRSGLARKLGVPASKRLAALLDALFALDVIAETEGVVTPRIAPPCVLVLPRDGWGNLATVIRTDRPLATPAGEVASRYHAHLVTAGAAAQREVAARLGATRLVDLGGGAGGYTAAVIAAHTDATVTLVDAPSVIELARVALPARVTFVPGDAREVELPPHEVALLANVLHGHDETSCAALCAAATRAVVPGGTVAIVDFWIDDDRRGPLTAAMFALSMALYTEGGAVYPAAQITAWLIAAGLDDVRVVRLDDAPEMMLLTAQRPRELRR